MHRLSHATSAILNGRRDLFRHTVFRTLWSQINDAITTGQIRFVDRFRANSVGATKTDRQTVGTLIPTRTTWRSPHTAR